MATGTVSASVDLNVKRIAGAYLREAGTTPNEVIRNLWEHIAATGEIPTFAQDSAPEEDDSEPEAFLRLMELRSSVQAPTPLSTMTKADLRRELEDRDV